MIKRKYKKLKKDWKNSKSKKKTNCLNRSNKKLKNVPGFEFNEQNILYSKKHRKLIKSYSNKIKKAKQFECDQCEYKCNQSSSLTNHKRIHTNEKPYECNQEAIRRVFHVIFEILEKDQYSISSFAYQMIQMIN